ncbi:4'-phosphopantetheinyl transferase superfamily protein [Reichenbachiella agarivorans]|uniref:4'-phosphopantetheinyl transferase superfamily protein n=1 Tax=Reichenbachiella agarivorans TaxID=2979464 RepID=A0ABY6CR54_9BACT|nr:4'-phosphopantetheinyl transferase family protein [Reichenbachiella agarivorans]UXP31943.1 4'-phosphopantetheinyl transferase superfamily protein [Reichenbachiella agarivorans]
MIKKQFKISNHIILGIWEIDESLEQLAQGFDQKELDCIAHFHPLKKAEHIASRQLIQSMCQEMDIPFHGICKDSHGKPHLIDSDYHISLSHSYPKIAAMINLDVPCGIDIEQPREQLRRVKSKFLNPAELQVCQDDLDLLCIYWCAKESIYKMHGRKNLSFAQNIEINRIKDNQIFCSINKDQERKKFVLNMQQEDDYLITYNL